MTALEWDQVGERRFETGIDRGVLYLQGGDAIPWNGLVSVTEDQTREVKSYYLDGVKYLDHHVPGSYSAKLQAFTYPDELEELLGTTEFAPGVFVHDQRARMFSLSYRTRVGNDLEGVDHGYKIHLIYNVMAVPSSFAAESMAANVTAKPFELSLSGTPSAMFGIRPTSHISLHSRTMDPELLSQLEATLYGADMLVPSLPDLVSLLAAVEVS